MVPDLRVVKPPAPQQQAVDLEIEGQQLRVVRGAGPHGFRWYSPRFDEGLDADQWVEVQPPSYAALVTKLTGLEPSVARAGPGVHHEDET